MAQVFISYKRENKDAVHAIVEGLRGAGLDVWWDNDIAPDAPWEATIERELEAAKVVVVAWSRAAAQSENVKAEARRARQQGKLVQVFVEACEPPLFFGERQGVDLTSWNGNGNDGCFQTLISAARAIIAGKSPPQGVGYVAKRRSIWPISTAVFVVLTGAVGLVANMGGARDTLCSTQALASACTEWGLASVERAPTEELQASLIGSLSGVWGRLDRNCSETVTFTVEQSGGEPYRLRASAPGFEVVEQVISIDTAAGVVMTRSLTPNAQGLRETFEYRPDGDILSMRDAAGVDTTMARCSGT